MTASTLSFHEIFITEWMLIDAVVFVVFAGVHAWQNWDLIPKLSTEDGARQESFTFTSTLATGSVTAVGILLPLSLAAVGTFITKGTPSRAVLVNVFAADVWLALSLALCLFVLWTIGFRAHTENVQNLREVRLPNGWQFIALLLGVVRLLIAASFLVQHPT